VDFKQAFLNGTLEDDVYIQQPEGFQDGTPRVLKLKKSLYGLKQAPRAWHETLKAALIQLGYTQSKADPGLFLKDDSWLLLYVDDQLLIGPDEAILEGVITLLAVRFQLTDMGNAKFYLGVDMDISPGRVALSQKRYIKDLLQKFPSPKPARQVLTPGVIRREDTSPLLQSCDVFPRIIGALLYLAVWTRPDISNATQKLSRVLACPTQDDLDAAYRILHYLSSTQDLEIVYTAAALPLYTSYCDADYASDALCVPKRRSTSGAVVFLGGGPIIWASRTQHSVALSTCEAEYMAAGVAAREVLWLRHLLPELHFDLNGPSEIQCDNESCLALIKDPICNSKSKHIDILHHFVREHVLQKTLIFKFVPGTENVADIFTKPLEWPVFQTHRRKLLQSPV
jgi:histone deacetylase 1/2